MEKQGRRVAILALLALSWAGAADYAASAEKAGDHRLRLIRSWPENPIVDGRAVPGRVEIWFDYSAGLAIHKVIANAKGPGGVDRVISSRTYPPGVGQPRPSPEEIAEAMDIVRADKEVGRVIAATNAVLDGGFQIFQPAGQPCAPGSRCLKIQLLTQDRVGFIRNVIVDLNTQAIVYQTYLPAEEGKGK
jgi:hypothetical protein